jgi:hypothetical protein
VKCVFVHLVGEKNGQKIGNRLSIAQKDAVEIAINKKTIKASISEKSVVLPHLQTTNSKTNKAAL